MNRVAVPLAIAAMLAACDDQAGYNRGQNLPAPASLEGRLPVPAGAAPVGAGALREALLSPGPQPTLALLEQGRERYDIFCSACHGAAGYGDGMVTTQGFPAPPSFHDDARLQLTPERIVAVITNGYGRMYPFADRVPPAERWAIAHYLKALQLSQSPDLAATGAGQRTTP